MKRLGFLCGVVAVLLLCHPTNAMATVVCTDDALSDAASALLVDAFAQIRFLVVQFLIE